MTVKIATTVAVEPSVSEAVQAAVAWVSKQQRHLPLTRSWRSPLPQTGTVAVEASVEGLTGAPVEVVSKVTVGVLAEGVAMEVAA